LQHDPMQFEIACEKCGEKLKVDRRYIGRKGRCPKCRTKFIIPDPDATPKEFATKASDLEDTLPARVVSPRVEDDDDFDEVAFAPVFPWHVMLVERLKLMPCWLISALVHAVIIFLIAGISWQVVRQQEKDITVNVQLKQKRGEEEVYIPREDDTKTLDDILEKLQMQRPGRGPEIGEEVTMEKSQTPLGVIGIGGLRDIGTGKKLVISGGNVNFFGVKGGKNITSVVYVVDASSSMDGRRIERAKAELKRSISELNLANRFTVFFFSDPDKVREFQPQRGLVIASGENKEACYRFIDSVEALGSTYPGPALERALRYKPDVLYLLTDGEFTEPVDGIIAVLNKDRHTKINTIGFCLNAQRDAQFINTLRRIARQNKGTFKLVR